MPWWPTRGSWAPRLLWFNFSGRLRQQNPAQNHAVRLVLTRSPPMFPPAIWIVHDATVNGDARTNNMCEGWNNNFVNLVGHAHPSIWRVIECCQKKLLSVLLSSKMPSVIHQLSVLNRDMFSSRSVYRIYAETSLLTRRPLPSSCVELGGTSDSITNISA